jgi:hypothetical protein
MRFFPPSQSGVKLQFFGANMTKENFDRAWNLMTELRKETLEGQRMRTQVIGFKITIVSTGIGVIIANIEKVPKELLAIPAFASVFFDLLIINYSISIRRVGLYCQKYLEPILEHEARMKNVSLSDAKSKFCWWEEFVDLRHVRPRFAIIANLGFTFLAILAAYFVLLTPFRWPYFSLALLLAGLFIYDWLAFLIPKKIARGDNDKLTRFFIGSYMESDADTATNELRGSDVLAQSKQPAREVRK